MLLVVSLSSLQTPGAQGGVSITSAIPRRKEPHKRRPARREVCLDTWPWPGNRKEQGSVEGSVPMFPQPGASPAIPGPLGHIPVQRAASCKPSPEIMRKNNI